MEQSRVIKGVLGMRRGGAFLMFAASVGLLGCKSEGDDLSLRKAPPVQESVSSQQKLRVFNTVTKAYEFVPFDVIMLSAIAGDSNCNTAGSNCSSALCFNDLSLGHARMLLSLTRPQAAPVQLGQYRLDPFNASLRASAAYQAWTYARGVGGGVLNDLHFLEGTVVGPGNHCVPLDVNVPYSPPAGVQARASSPHLVFAATELAEAYNLMVDAADAVVDNMVQAGDSGTTIPSEIADVCQPETSRRGAAQFLVGTRDLFSDTPRPAAPFCDVAELSGDGRAALAVFREAGPPPTDVLGAGGGALQYLLDGPTGALFSSSVQQRIGNLYQYPQLIGGAQTIEQYYGLDFSAFQEARNYLVKEINVFERSRSALLAARRLPGGTVTPTPQYAGTATEPTPLPGAYYLAQTRMPVNHVEFQPGSDPPIFWWPSSTRCISSADAIDAFQSHVADILAHLPTDPSISGTVNQVRGTLGLLSANGERTGRISVSRSSTFTTTIQGFGPSDQITVVQGEDAMRCATTGTIEGSENCGFSGGTVALTTNATHAVGFSSAAANSLPVSFLGSRLYFLKPFRNLSLPGPGDFRLLGAANTNSESRSSASTVSPTNWTLQVPIVPRIQDRLQDLLAPSKSACEKPSMNCNNARYDARIPLEDELSSDGDGVESSWKHYLQVAREAADRADSLGLDYVSSRLDQSRRDEDLSLRREQQSERADAELETVRDACGSNINLTALAGFANFGYSGSSGTLDEAISLSAGLSGDPDMVRLQNCLSAGTTEPYVSFGTTPLCFWKTGQNSICDTPTRIQFNLPDTPCPPALTPYPPGATSGTCLVAPGSCPKLQDKNDPSCTAAFGLLPTAAQLGTTTGALLGPPTTTLGYFDTPPVTNTTPPGTRCPALAAARDRDTYAANQGAIEAGSFLNALTLTEYAKRLDWEGRYGGYSAIYIDQKPVFQTGSLESGPVTNGTWPCLPAGQTVFSGVPGYFGQGWNCADDTQRAQANYAMLRLVAAAKMLTSDSGTGTFPLRAAPTNFPAIALLAIPTTPYQLQTFWSGAYPIRRYTLDDWFGYVGDSACTGKPCVRWLAADGSQPIASGDPVRFGPFVIDAGYTQKQNTPSGVDTGGHDISTPSPFHTLLTHASGLLHGEALPGVSYWFDIPPYTAHLGGSVKTAMATTSATPPPAANGPTIDIIDRDVLGGLEILCKISESGLPPIDLSTPPAITSLDDLPMAAAYIEQLGNTIRARVSTLILSNVPQVVADALREESVQGSYPRFGGQMAANISNVRESLTAVRQTGPLLANEMTQMATELKNLYKYLQQNANQAEIADLQFVSTQSEQLSRCASGLASASTIDFAHAAGAGVAALITCANSVAQIHFADGIRDLQKKNDELASEISINTFGSQFSTHATNLQTYALRILQSVESVDSGLAAIEALRSKARRALTRSLYYSSFQAVNEAEITTTMGNLADVKQNRYAVALTNAKRLTDLAKRAVEQRLGRSLSQMTDDLPFVDAPANWENSICDVSGLNYATLSGMDPTQQGQTVGGSFAGMFIGDYVTKLENLVESYRLENNFHEGQDLAIVSLKNDIMGIRKECATPGPNLLYWSGKLDQNGTPGWSRINCKTTVENGQTVMAADCIETAQLGNIPLPRTMPSVAAFQFIFGTGAGHTTSSTPSALVQTVSVTPGRYRFSWYTGDPQGVAGAKAGKVVGNGLTQTTGWVAGSPSTNGDWNRAWIQFDVSSPQNIQVGFWNQNSNTATNPIYVPVNVAAPQLERLPSAVYNTALTPFTDTHDTLDAVLPICEDKDGGLFRSKWRYDCLRLCPDGFSDRCQGAGATTHCYREAKFNINQRELQLGRMMQFSGFAKGNFNYRIESLGVNFVGTSVRDCSTASVPTPCFSSGFVPYSIEHSGPFYVRNDLGLDYRALLFDGHIEHARGLALERYFTNPLSTTDRELISDYMRTEFEGRPLDGTFTVRVWDDPNVDFEAIQDVQVLLRYRYWTRFN